MEIGKWKSNIDRKERRWYPMQRNEYFGNWKTGNGKFKAEIIHTLSPWIAVRGNDRRVQFNMQRSFLFFGHSTNAKQARGDEEKLEKES
jgi:hypothetical protein